MARMCEQIVFSGRVQGVGFRLTAVALARDLPLSGTVRNAADGTVELLVQGETADIEALIGRLREHFGAFIRNVKRSAATVRKLPPGVRVVA